MAKQINLKPLYYPKDINQKNQLGIRLNKSKESGVTTQGRKEVEVCTVLLGNDKNNVIADKVSHYF